MPQVKKSKEWYIRITAPWEHIRSKVPVMVQWIDYVGHMIGYHHGEKRGAPHAHIALRLSSELQQQSVRARFTKLFDVAGTQYASKPWDGDKKALSYLYHDSGGVVENALGLSNEEIDALKDLNTNIQKVVEENKERSSHKVVDYVLKEADGNVLSRREIITVILRAVAQGLFYDPGDFVLERYANEIELKQVVGDKDRLQEAIDARIARLPSFKF